MRVVLPVVIVAAAVAAAFTDTGAVAVVFTMPVVLGLAAARWPRSMPVAAALVPTALVVTFVDAFAHLFTPVASTHGPAMLAMVCAAVAHVLVTASTGGHSLAERAPGLVTFAAALAAMVLSFAPHHVDRYCYQQYAAQDSDTFCMWECGARDESPPQTVCEDQDVTASKATRDLGPLCLFVVLVFAGLAAGNPRKRVFAAFAAGAMAIAVLATLPVTSVRWPQYAGVGRAFDASIAAIAVGALAMLHQIWKQRRARSIPEARAQ